MFLSTFLSTVSLPLCILGGLLCLLSLGAFYRAWQLKRRYWPLIGLASGLWLLAFCPWILAFGADRGFFIPPMLLGCAALLLIIGKTNWRQLLREQPGANRLQSSRDLQIKSLSLTQRLGRFAQTLVVTGLLSFTAALGLAFTLFAYMDSSTANRLVAAALAMLVIWPVFMLWSRASSKLTKPGCWFIGLSCIGLLIAQLAP